MLLSRFREKYEEQTRIVGSVFARLGISPNAVTAIGLVLGLLAGGLLWGGMFRLGVLVALLSALFDMADGATARYLNSPRPFGTLLDRVCDRYVEFFLVLGAVGSGHVHPFWGMTCLFGMVMASYVRATAESVGRVKNCSVGMMERKEKLFLLLCGAFLEPVLNPAGLAAISLNPLPYCPKEGFLVLQAGIVLSALLSHLTTCQRLAHARRHENEF